MNYLFQWPGIIKYCLSLFWCNYISHLEQIGFEWEVQDSRWMKCFEELKAFIAVEHRCPKRGEDALNA